MLFCHFDDSVSLGKIQRQRFLDKRRLPERECEKERLGMGHLLGGDDHRIDIGRPNDGRNIGCPHVCVDLFGKGAGCVLVDVGNREEGHACVLSCEPSAVAPDLSRSHDRQTDTHDDSSLVRLASGK